MKMNRAIFLGSFNPPHKGHLNCINSIVKSGVMNTLNIRKIHIIPCWQNPNKDKSIDFWKRYEMSMLMFAELNDYIIIDDIEAIIQPKYTYELIDQLHSGEDLYINKNFWWIITEETYEELLQNKWKESQKLLDNNRFIIVYNGIRTDWTHRSYAKAMKEHRIVHVPLIDNITIHSTQLREKIKNNEDISDDTNVYVNNFIKDNKLFI